jgi:hypothetical protein
MRAVAMRYALVTDIPVSWAAYEELAAAALDELPAGLIVHAAGPTDEGVRMVDVWQSEDAYRAFREERLLPLLARRPGAPKLTFLRDVRVRRLAAPSVPAKRKAST